MHKVAIWGPLKDGNWHAQARQRAREQFPQLVPEDNPTARWTGVTDAEVKAVIAHPDAGHVAKVYGEKLPKGAVVVLEASTAQAPAKAPATEEEAAAETSSKSTKKAPAKE